MFPGNSESRESMPHQDRPPLPLLSYAAPGASPRKGMSGGRIIGISLLGILGVAVLLLGLLFAAWALSLG